MERNKELYLNFDEYIRQGEPAQREKAGYWQTAIGLQNNVSKGIDYAPIYLERFFRNLLLGEQWDLRNRYLHIHPTEEWRVLPNLSTPANTQQEPEQEPEQVPEQVGDLFHINNPLVIGLIRVIGHDEFSISQLMERVGLKHRPNFMEYHLNPAIADGYVRLRYPDKPRHPRQKYLLTARGLALYKELTKEEDS